MRAKLARGGELAELVPDHPLVDVHRDELVPVVHREVWPTNSGVMVQARDQVLSTFFWFDLFSAVTSPSAPTLMNGPS